MVFYPPAIYTGADGNSGNAGSFEICDLRLHSGALYTSNFTPPTTKNTANSDDELLVLEGHRSLMTAVRVERQQLMALSISAKLALLKCKIFRALAKTAHLLQAQTLETATRKVVRIHS